MRQAALLAGGDCARVLGLAASVGPSAEACSRARGGVHRLRVLSGLPPVACGVLLMLVAVPPQALASANLGTGVQASLPANAGKNTDALVNSVSCASAGNCTAVGSYTDSSGHGQGLLLSETSGRWAAGVEASLPANAGTNPDAFSDRVSVSCASAGNCTAVGGYKDSSGHQQGLLLSETSGRWAAGVEASLPAGAGTSPLVQLFSVSCASAGNCSAVGIYTDSSGHEQGLLLSETSGRWATGVEASLPANAGTNPNVGLPSVSCASAGNCTAVGTYTSSGAFQGLLLSETSGTWATGVEAALPAGTGTDTFVSLFSVSCASTGNCTAVGIYTDDSSGDANRHGLLLSETSGTWAAGVEAPLPANASTNTTLMFTGFVDSVSCASAGNCTAIGDYLDSSGHVQGLLLSETSGRWATGVEASLPTNARTNPDAFSDGGSVSCASAGNCTAFGSYTDSSGHSQGLLLSETSGTWATGVEASLPTNAGTNPDADLYSLSVSCASAGNCTAVGSYKDSSDNEQGVLFGGVNALTSALAVIGSPTSNGASVTDKLTCVSSAMRPCQATEALTTTETTRSGRSVALQASARRKSRTVTVARKKVMIRPGKKATVTVKLNASGRKLLARLRKLPVTLTITLLQNGRHLTIAKTKLTVKPQKKT
jgi:hypothetical protein